MGELGEIWGEEDKFQSNSFCTMTSLSSSGTKGSLISESFFNLAQISKKGSKSLY
jgi:hypothetical protein